MIYAKFKGRKHGQRYGPWKFHNYKTREGALKAMKKIEKEHGKRKKYSWGSIPGAYFKIVKK